MLNQERTFEKKELKEFTLLKNDVYQAELIDVNIETKQKYQSTEMEDVLSFEFAVLAGRDTEGQDARLRLLSKNFVPTNLYISSKKGKNWLYKVIEALIDRDLTKEEEANGITSKTLNFLVGKQCRLILEKVVSKKDAQKFYSNISNILPADSQITPLSIEEKTKIAEQKQAWKDKQNGQPNNTDFGESNAADQDSEIDVSNIPF